jgi:dTDP-glucose 4,6-dehydratase
LRHYIHGRNVGSALLFLLDKKPYLAKSNGDVASYHIVGEIEMDNALLANTIADIVTRYCVTNDMDFGKYEFEMVDFHSSRPGHDLRYALDGSKMKGLGWEPPKSFHTSLKKTVEWFINNPRWLQ